MVIRSPSTTALIETTSAPWIPRSVLAASCTAASAAFAKLSGDEPMIVITLATSAISSSQQSFSRRTSNRGGLGPNELMPDSEEDMEDAALLSVCVLAQELVELDTDEEDDRRRVRVDHQDEKDGQL